jgi:hypothetical protein
MKSARITGERAIRQRAQRLGLSLRKARLSAVQRRYWLVTPDGNNIVAGDNSGLSLDEVSLWLARRSQSRPC